MPRDHDPSDASAPARRPRVVVAIPARYGSTRLPGKALAPLAGRPMIEHVWRRACAAEGVDRVVVLTDDERIARAVAGFGGVCEMTPADCRSGSDRIAWAARRWPPPDDGDGDGEGGGPEAIVNVQGDEPLIEPGAIAAVARHLAAVPGDPIVTLATPAEPADAARPDLVKVVVDRRGYALYFSRAPIPYRRDDDGARPLGHIGIYGYQRQALLELAALEPSPLERAESLEQLRALENGIAIRVLTTEHGWFGVDTPEDLARAEALLGRGD